MHFSACSPENRVAFSDHVFYSQFHKNPNYGRAFVIRIISRFTSNLSPFLDFIIHSWCPATFQAARHSSRYLSIAKNIIALFCATRRTPSSCVRTIGGTLCRKRGGSRAHCQRRDSGEMEDPIRAAGSSTGTAVSGM